MDEDVLDRLIREAEETETAAEVSPPSVASGGAPLAGLLSNPAVLSALPTLLSGGKGASSVKKQPDRHTALLCAIKPYLGKERQATADQLISLCRLWDTLQGTGLLQMLPGLLGGIHPATDAETERKEV